MAQAQNKDNRVVQEVAHTINVVIPAGRTPLLIKIIALLTSIGGLSILANILSDVVVPTKISLGFYIMRMLTGVAMVSVGYGILKNKGWTVWLYGAITLIGLAVNPIIAILPLAVTIYLYSQKKYFDRTLPRQIWTKLIKISAVKE